MRARATYHAEADACRGAAAVALLVAVLGSGLSARTGALEDAIALYRSAQYDEALTVLEGLRSQPDGLDARGRESIAEYQALCLLALERASDARNVVRDLVTQHPDYRPSAADVPPRYLALVAETRAALWPSLVRAEYRAGKTSYDAKAYEEASSHFRKVASMLGDSGVDAAVRETLADVGDLATGFLAVIEKSGAPSPAPAPSLPTPSAPPAAIPTPAPSTVVYSREDSDVTPPAVVSQEIPAWRSAGFEQTALAARGARGILEVLIDANGRVEDVRLQAPIHPLYDARLLSTAKQWRYRPATRQGVPVRYRKLIAVQLLPAGGETPRS